MASVLRCATPSRRFSVWFDCDKLLLIQIPVNPLPGQQLEVRAALHNLPVIHHQDQIRVLDRAQPVRDNDGRPAGEQSVQRSLDQRLGHRVHMRRGLVQDQDARVGLTLPLALASTGGLLFPGVFALGTTLPLLVFTALITADVVNLRALIGRIKSFDLWAQRIIGLVFVLIGINEIVLYWFL